MNTYAQVMSITPDKAKEMLNGNTMNRTKNQVYIRSLAKEMKDGNWAMTGQPIVVSKEGILLDGQHRLEAVIASGVPIDLMVVRGVDKDTFKFIDTGKGRSAGDMLSIEGYKDSTGIAVVAKVIMAYENGVISATGGKGVGVREKATYGLTNSNILAYIKEHEKLVKDCRRVAESCRKFGKFLTMTDYALFYYILGNIDPKEAETFLHQISKGNSLSDGHPVLLLRNKFIDARTFRRPYTQKVKLGMTFKAWNLHRQGRIKGNVAFNLSEELPKLL